MPGEYEKSVASLNNRKQQMLALIEFRPYWLRRGICTDGKNEVSIAGDAPCPCDAANFSCQLHSLTKIEYSNLNLEL